MKYRMYSFVLRQLSPIQKGVQTTHAVVEYEILYGKTKEYKNWSNVDKTLIILDGGTYTEMLNILESLHDEGIRHSYFIEEDLNNLITSITVIADERVWDKKTYTDFESWISTQEQYLDCDIEKRKEAYIEWIKLLGGKNNIKLREIIFSKRLST